jgi:2-C-methyl-D-erythritol 2,4-cyclodiphosphate synthase
MIQPVVDGINNSRFRTGIGFDAHAFSDDENRPMWLAGLHWPDEVGIEAHSDGDVAAHAICDALFAAAGLGDLGTNFGVDRLMFQCRSSEIVQSWDRAETRPLLFCRRL